jgi:hypothetical protein
MLYLRQRNGLKFKPMTDDLTPAEDQALFNNCMAEGWTIALLGLLFVLATVLLIPQKINKQHEITITNPDDLYSVLQ